jgi:Ca2+-binding RTX toxin-like protein
MATHYGTNSGETIDYFGYSEAMTIFAYGGNDKVKGSHYGDQIVGGDGNDELYGYNGNDTIWGQDGDDWIEGHGGLDRLVGGAGHDTVNGGTETDWLWGEGGDDLLQGEEGDDQLFGGAGNDILYGEYTKADWNGNDWLNGGDGNDELYGGGGRDTLLGGTGNDIVAGGRGADLLTGGTGADSFRFTAGDVVTSTGSIFGIVFNYDSFETDTITDFAATALPAIGHDVLDIASLLDGKTSFAGTTGAQAITQGYVYWVQHGQPGQADFGTTVYVDRDGGLHNPNGMFGFGDFAIADLQGVAANQLNASHFVV